MHKGNDNARMENLRNTLFILILTRDGRQQSKPKHQTPAKATISFHDHIINWKHVFFFKEHKEENMIHV